MVSIKTGRARLLIGCILAIGLAFLFVWPSALVWGQEPGGRPVSLDVILLIDNSRSMSHEDAVTGAPPSDPEELRIRAAKFLVDYLRANAETLGANYRVGVVSFGGVVSEVTSLRLLQDDTVREGIRAEVIRLTDFRGPLQFALREFRAKSLGTGNKMAIILLTDGCPDLTGPPMTEQELLDYFEDLAPLVGELQEGGASLFILGIGDAQKDRDNWTRLIPPEHYISITSATELADVYHDIVAGLIGVAVSEGETIPAGQTVSVEVEPYLERVVFSFVKNDPAIHIILISPTGVILTPTIEAADIHHAIYRITNPDAGEWKALWEGEGEVRYWVDKQYLIVRVEPIESASLVGQPITITVSLVRNNVTVVDPGLHLKAEITLPGGDVITQGLSPIGGGRYTGGYEDVKMEGTYMVTVRAFFDGQPLSAHPLPVAVTVFPLPAVATPTLGPTPSPSVTPTTVEQVTPTPTPMVNLPWEGLVLSRVTLFLWLISLGLLGLGLLVGWVLWKRETEDVRKLGPSWVREFPMINDFLVRQAEYYLEPFGRLMESMQYAYAEFRERLERYLHEQTPQTSVDLESSLAHFEKFVLPLIMSQRAETEVLIEDSGTLTFGINGYWRVYARRSLIFQAVSQICNPHMYWFPGS